VTQKYEIQIIQDIIIDIIGIYHLILYNYSERCGHSTGPLWSATVILLFSNIFFVKSIVIRTEKAYTD